MAQYTIQHTTILSYTKIYNYARDIFLMRQCAITSGQKVFICILFWCVFATIYAEAQASPSTRPIIWGTDNGLYRRIQGGRTENLWSGGKVKKILKWTENPPSIRSSAVSSGWVLLADNGIWVSENLKNWEDRSAGLPNRIIKIYENGEKSLVPAIQEIKDLEINPSDPQIMVCAFKDSVYLSRDRGRSWENLGMPNYRSNGIKAAVSFFNPEGELTVLCAHSIYGVYYFFPGKIGAKWIEISDGLEKLETTGNGDEVSDFAVFLNTSGEKAVSDIYASQSFRNRIYRLDFNSKKWEPVWQEPSEFGAVDSLSAGKDSLLFVREAGIMELGGGLKAINADNKLPLGSIPVKPRQDILNIIRSLPGNQKPSCIYLEANAISSGSEAVHLCELWLLDEGANARTQGSQRTGSAGTGTARRDAAGSDNIRSVAAGKEGLYLPVNHAMDSTSLKPYLETIENRKLNMVVIDMKDDYGRLRFTPQNPLISTIGRVFRPVDLEVFLETMKEKGIYTVARIVVFKDPEAATKNGAKYAVWDGAGNKPWEGYYDVRQKKTPPGEAAANPALKTAILPADDNDYEILRTWYDEKWVDPYSEEIWDYNASIAEELCEAGFDEIQFDYIRFPTDGINLSDARYRWKDDGMDMDSAILSFLRHVRSRVKAPISVDIYGANGWYRTGARTGQEVELLAPWVDVICPMYYPSHFEQDFLAQAPAEQRPYRIYYQGTLRTRYIARGQVIVRPWAQAFYLNVSYDRKYYNTDYVRLQAEAVRAAGSGGLTYWNNSGRYDDLPFPP